MVVVPRRHEDQRLAVRRLEHVHDVRRDQRAPRERAEVDGLEMGERGVVAVDRQHGLVRLEALAVVERVDLERVEPVGAELEDGDRLVHAAQIRVALLEDLHQHLRVAAVSQQRRTRVVEVGVGVPARAHLLDREVEDARVEPRASRDHARSSSRHASRAAFATSSCSCVGSRVAKRCCSSWPGQASARAAGWLGVPGHPAERLDRRRERPDGGGRSRDGPHRGGSTLGGDVADGGGEQQRADQVRAAALVLLRAVGSVLVRADRHVLGPVVRGDLALAQDERGRRERQQRRRELAYGGRETRALQRLDCDDGRDHRHERARALHRERRLRQRALDRRQQREHLGDARRPTEQRRPHARRGEALVPRHDLQVTVGRAHGAGPRGRAVHEHPVLERHPAEPHLLLHLGELKRTSRYLRAPSTRR